MPKKRKKQNLAFPNNYVKTSAREIDVTDSPPQSLTSRLALSIISLLFVDRFGRSVRFCHLEFDKEDIYDG